MKDRLLYGFAALALGIVVGLVAAIAYAGVTMGIAWLFVFGDRGWPEWFYQTQSVITVAIGFAAFLVVAVRVYRSLVRLHSRAEAEARRKAGTVALGALAVLIFFAWR